MRIERELEQARIDRDSALTIGVFDGVHLGHQSLIAKVIAEARAKGCAAGALTFRNHPDSVFNPNFQPQYITSLEERIRLYRRTRRGLRCAGYFRYGGCGAAGAQVRGTAAKNAADARACGGAGLRYGVQARGQCGLSGFAWRGTRLFR